MERAGEGKENDKKEKARQKQTDCMKSQKDGDRKDTGRRAERKIVWWFLKKSNRGLQYDRGTPLIGTDPKH